MSKLLSANFYRMLRSKEFQLSAISIVLFSVFRFFLMLSEHGDEVSSLDDGFFIYVLIVVIIMSAFVSLFVGTEHSCNTFRNMISSGHKREHIYLADFIVCTVAGWIFCAIYLIISIAMCAPLLGWFKLPITDVLIKILYIFLLTAAYATILVFIAMLNQSRSVTVAVSILLVFVMLFVGFNISRQLDLPEVERYVEFTQDGDVIDHGIEFENPRYVGGAKRTVYQFINDFMPGGQAMLASGMLDEEIPTARIFVYDVLLIVLMSGCGLVLFRKKNLR